MMFQSRALQSDALVMQGQSTFENHPDHIVMRTPAEPHYWQGNALIMKTAPKDLQADITLFRKYFPQAAHITLTWDIPNLDPHLLRKQVSKTECSVDTFDLLSCNGPPKHPPQPDGIMIRPISTDQEWQAVQDLQSKTAVEQGYDPTTHTPFLRRRIAANRTQIANGIGQWFGAFDGDLLVADMGIFRDSHIGRYQSVETRATHRRRGICAALLHHAAHWAPGTERLIMAEADSAAGRLYRRMGFARAETLAEVTKPGT